MTRIILLSNQIIDTMLTDPGFVEFAFASDPPRTANFTPRVRPSGRRCGGCSRSKRKDAVSRVLASNIDYNAIKKIIASMSKEPLDALKARLSCTGLQIQYQNADGAVEKRVV